MDKQIGQVKIHTFTQTLSYTFIKYTIIIETSQWLYIPWSQRMDAEPIWILCPMPDILQLFLRTSWVQIQNSDKICLLLLPFYRIQPEYRPTWESLCTVIFWTHPVASFIVSFDVSYSSLGNRNLVHDSGKICQILVNFMSTFQTDTVNKRRKCMFFHAHSRDSQISL